MAKKEVDPEFPCSLTIRTPFPTHRLASSALKALQVDAELSPLVRRSFSLISSSPPSSPTVANGSGSSSSHLPRQTPLSSTTNGDGPASGINRDGSAGSGSKTILVTEYKAKTNRMLRVAVNGFMESLGVVLGVMERLDVDVLPSQGAAPPPAPATVAAGN